MNNDYIPQSLIETTKCSLCIDGEVLVEIVNNDRIELIWAECICKGNNNDR